MEKVVDTISRYPVIDPKYEFSAPQYVDFSHEESHGDIDRADQWFSSAIPNEASPHAPRIGSVIELLAARDRSRQASDKEARKILAHVSHGPRQTNEQVTIGWEQSSEFEVAPESLIVDWLGEFTATTIPALSPVTSPMPTKRSYAEVCDESAHPPETMRKKTELADIRWSYNDRRDKAAARKAQVSEEFQAGKRQKLDRGRTKQIMQRCPSLQEPREVSPFVSMAERVQKFLHKTPPRFHVLPARVGISQLLEMEKPKSPKLTMPKTPEFQTMRRIRSSRFKSAEEIEIEELAKIPKFKARPLNKRVFQSSGDLGLLRIHKRKVTVPMEFRSETSRRAQVRNSVLRIQEFDKEQGLVKLIRTVGSTVEREQKDAGALISEVQYILSNAPIFTPVQSTNPLAEISQSKLNINQQALEYEKKKKEKKVNNAMRRKVIAQPAPQFDEPSIPQRSMKGLTKATLPILNLKAPGAELTTSYSWAEEIPLEQKRIFMR